MSHRLELTGQRLEELLSDLDLAYHFGRSLTEATEQNLLTALDLEELTRRLELAARRSALLEVYYLREVTSDQEGDL